MTTKTRYYLGGKAFSTQEDILSYAKEIKDQAVPCQQIDDPDQIAFLTDLLNCHYDTAVKIGPGIDFFSVRYNNNATGTEFIVSRTDGECVNFSPKKCLGTFKKITHICEACRHEVWTQIADFRQRTLAAGQVMCPFHGTELNEHNSHVDHRPPDTFVVLVRRWLSDNGWTEDDIRLGGTGGLDANKTLASQEQRESWQHFHEANAQLRLTSVRGNLSDSKLEKTR